MKLSKINIIIPFIFLLAWSCKPKCPVYSCKIRMHHRHGLIMKPRTLEEWGKEVNQKLNGDTTQTDSATTEGLNNVDSAYVNFTGDSTLAEPKLTRKERKAKKKQEKEERKRKKREEKEAKKRKEEQGRE